MNRYLITGGAGFIGSAVCRRLAGELGWGVLNVDKLTYAASLESVASVAGGAHYRFLKADISDGPAMAAAFAEFKRDAVIHLAAESHVDRSIERSAAFMQTNDIGTHALLEAARSYCSSLTPEGRRKFRLLHVSTGEV